MNIAKNAKGGKTDALVRTWGKFLLRSKLWDSAYITIRSQKK